MICEIVCLFYDVNSRRFNRKWLYGDVGNRTCDPWFTRNRFIPYTTAASLVNTHWTRNDQETTYVLLSVILLGV